MIVAIILAFNVDVKNPVGIYYNLGLLRQLVDDVENAIKQVGATSFWLDQKGVAEKSVSVFSEKDDRKVMINSLTQSLSLPVNSTRFFPTPPVTPKRRIKYENSRIN